LETHFSKKKKKRKAVKKRVMFPKQASKFLLNCPSLQKKSLDPLKNKIDCGQALYGFR
jgi:hypothetical protein